MLAAASWELQNHFRVAASSSGGSSSGGGGGGAATALSWRQPAPGLPPLLLVGTAQAGAQIWVYQQQLMRWEQAATLGSPQVRRGPAGAGKARHPACCAARPAPCTGCLPRCRPRCPRWIALKSLAWAALQDYGGKPVADVAWAPTLGRPHDIAAVAAGPLVLLWKLTGTADSLQVGCSSADSCSAVCGPAECSGSLPVLGVAAKAVAASTPALRCPCPALPPALPAGGAAGAAAARGGGVAD